MNTIWERMLLEEKKKKAAELGIKVSELEERDNLSNAINDSIGDDRYDLHIDNNNNNHHNKSQITHNSDSNSSHHVDIDYDDEDDDNNDHHIVCYNDRTNSTIETNKSNNKLDSGGPWYKLPRVLVDRILIILGDIDMCGYLFMTSKSSFQPSEKVFEHLCKITYPTQTNRNQLNISKWQNSWRYMLINRPRLRTNGFYTLRAMYTKAPCNDAFWEEKKMQSIEVKFYRHIRFFQGGRMLYSLDTADPDVMYRLLSTALPQRKRIFEGHYILIKREVRVKVTLHYCVMWFRMRLLDGDDGYIGKHNMLKLLSHSSTALPGDFTEDHLDCFSSDKAAQAKKELYDWNDDNEPGRVYYPIPVVANLRFNRYYDFSGVDHRVTL